jgi:hypothetical protein
MKATSFGKLPRNRQQVSNIRHNMNLGNQVLICSKKELNDPLFMVCNKANYVETALCVQLQHLLSLCAF